jgi:hypothetical protein
MLENFEIWGNNGEVPTGMSGAGPDANFVYTPSTDKIVVTGAALPMSEPFTVTFTYQTKE